MDYRNEQEILLEMIEYANTNGPVRTSEDIITNIKEGNQTENQYVLDLSTHSVPLSQMEEMNFENYENLNVATARGQGLDNFGDLLNVPRIPAKPLLVEIELDAGVTLSENITIPAGTEVLLQGVYDDVPYDFRTTSDVTIITGTSEATVYAESSILGYLGSLPSGAVTGLKGYPNIQATNTEETSSGGNIEEDDDYRIRIPNWSQTLVRGSKEWITNYLSDYTGIDSFNLVPHYDGFGTLLIVCQTDSSLLSQIASDVYEDCMNITDFPPVCVLPEETVLDSLTVNISIGSNATLSEEELVQLVYEQVRVFVNGGTRRNGEIQKGLNIGEDFVPSKLIDYLFSEFPELSNVVPSSLSVVSVDADNIFVLQNWSVVVV